MTEGLVDAGKAISDRSKLYDAEESGLRSQFQQAKAAVASQFGRRSDEYASVSSIKF